MGRKRRVFVDSERFLKDYAETGAIVASLKRQGVRSHYVIYDAMYREKGLRERIDEIRRIHRANGRREIEGRKERVYAAERGYCEGRRDHYHRVGTRTEKILGALSHFVLPVAMVYLERITGHFFFTLPCWKYALGRYREDLGEIELNLCKKHLGSKGLIF